MILDDLSNEEPPVIFNVVRDLRSVLCTIMHPATVDAIIAESVRNSHE